MVFCVMSVRVTFWRRDLPRLPIKTEKAAQTHRSGKHRLRFAASDWSKNLLLCCDQIFTKEWSEKLSATFLNSRGVKHVEGAKLFFPEEMPDLIDLEALPAAS